MYSKTPTPVNHNTINKHKNDITTQESVKSKKRTRKKKISTKSPSRKRTSAKKRKTTPFENLSSSLRFDCLRLADYLKQESHRKGYVF